jgi:hypothetical protein
MGLDAPSDRATAASPASAPGRRRSEPGSASEPGTAVPPDRTLLCPVIVGRDGEQEVLAARVAASAAGEGGGVVALIGEAGVGKTRLARATCAVARARGTTVLNGRAVPGRQSRPLSAFHRGVPGGVPLVGTPLGPGAGGLRRSAGPAGARLARRRAHRRRRVARPPRRGGRPAAAQLGRQRRRQRRRLPARPRRPALGDVETLAVLDYLADALVDERVLCLCTARPAGAAAETLARLRRQDPRAVIGLHALPRDDIDRVVTACLATGSPPPAVLSLVETHSEGNPFLIEELLAGLAASGALTFRDDRWTATGPLTPTVPFDSARPSGAGCPRSTTPPGVSSPPRRSSAGASTGSCYRASPRSTGGRWSTGCARPSTSSSSRSRAARSRSGTR